jgi:hypothetical protein
VNIPNSIKTIGNQTFWLCSKLTNVTIPESVKSIGIQAFAACNSLGTIIIPTSVTLIDIAAFDIHATLNIYFKSSTPPTIYDNVQSRVFQYSYVTIYVPVNSVDRYKNATNWRFYADRIVGYNF